MIEVSDLVRTELALEDSEARLGLAEKVAEFASWQWNVETGRLACNDSFEKLLGRGGRASNAPSRLFSNRSTPKTARASSTR